MDRSNAWRTQYRRFRALGEGHRDSVLNADTHFGKRRRMAGKEPLDTESQAIQSKGSKRGRVLPKFQDWPEDAVVQYFATGVAYSDPDDASSAGDADDDDTSDITEMVQRATGRKRLQAQRRGRQRRRMAALRPRRQAVVRNAILGNQSAADIIREAAAAKGTTPEDVVATVTAATETYSTSEVPGQAAQELAAAAQMETDAQAAAEAQLAAEILAYTQALAQTQTSDVAPDITVDELLAAYQTVPIPPTSYPMPMVSMPLPTSDSSCPSCSDDSNMMKLPSLLAGAPAFAPQGNLQHLLGSGIPNRNGSPMQRTAIPLAANTGIGAGAATNFTFQPVSDIEPGAVLWVSARGAATFSPPTITALSISGQNQLYGVAGAGLSQAFTDVGNFQSPGLFIPIRIPSNNSFQVTIQNTDGAAGIFVDIVLVGTAVQLVQALAACGVST
jgi:hypothetical protein